MSAAKRKSDTKKKKSSGSAAVVAVFLLVLGAVLLTVAWQRFRAPSPVASDEKTAERDADNKPGGDTDSKSADFSAEKPPIESTESVGNTSVRDGQDEKSESSSAENPTDGTENKTDTEKSPDAVSVGSLSDNEVNSEPKTISVTGISLSTYSVELTVGSRKMPIVTMYPENATDKGEIWTSDRPEIASVNGYGNITGNAVGTCTVTVVSRDNAAVSASVTVTVSEPVEPEVTYINGILIANKSYPLPSDYNPGTDPEAADALNTMIAAAAEENIKLWLRSGFRSYALQKTLYNGYAKRDGAAAADRYSARPGYSEHQTGLAFDLNSLSQSFADTAEGKWLAAHCVEYGFIIRYPKDKEEITGYMYEPWHVRYLGIDTAKAVSDSGLTLEEYLGITSVYAS